MTYLLAAYGRALFRRLDAMDGEVDGRIFRRR
jgi:hypothetical protein